MSSSVALHIMFFETGSLPEPEARCFNLADPNLPANKPQDLLVPYFIALGLQVVLTMPHFHIATENLNLDPCT